MRRMILAALALTVAFTAIGCGGVDGEKYADKMNEKMVAKIKAGEVKSELDMLIAMDKVAREALVELGYKEDAGITESENKKMEAKLEQYKDQWKKLIKDTHGS